MTPDIIAVQPARDPDLAPIPTPFELFNGFMRIASLSFGGVLPWARFVLVERRRWMSSQDFTDTLALCQLLPGPNIVNMSIAIGARFHGPKGALASIAGLMGLPVALVLAIAHLYAQFAGLAAVQGALTAMAAAAAGLIVAMAVKLAEPMLRRRFWSTAPFMALTFAAIALFRVPMLPVVIVMAPVAILAGWRVR